MPSSLKTLALDTSLAACSVAITEGERLRARRWIDLGRGHAERLFELVAEVEAEAGLKARQMDRMAVTVGPGTFTGLRVGLSAAKGLALAAECPLVGVGSLQAVALNLEPGDLAEDEMLVVSFDARRSEVYWQGFDRHLMPLTPPSIDTQDVAAQSALAAADEAGKKPVWLGSGAPLLQAKAEGAGKALDRSPLPDAGRLASFASALTDLSDYPPAPLYLRAPDAKLPKTKLFQT